MTLYPQEIWICATVYINADSAEEAAEMIGAREDLEEIMLDEGDELVSRQRFDDPNLPDFSLSPSATIHWDRTEGTPEEVA